eukprot:787750-Amphidinium_carterae.1
MLHSHSQSFQATPSVGGPGGNTRCCHHLVCHPRLLRLLHKHVSSILQRVKNRSLGDEALRPVTTSCFTGIAPSIEQ